MELAPAPAVRPALLTRWREFSRALAGLGEAVDMSATALAEAPAWVNDWLHSRAERSEKKAAKHADADSAQSPEDAAAKAQAELATGAWLVSLEFAVPGVLPCAQLRAPGGRVVWLYRMPLNRVEA